MAALAFFLLIPFTLGLGLMMVKALDQGAHDRRRKVYKLSFPAELDPERVASWLTAMSGSLVRRFDLLGTPSVAFELWSNKDGFTFKMLVPWNHDADYWLGQLQQMVPGVSANPEEHAAPRQWMRGLDARMTTPSFPIYIRDSADVAKSIRIAMNNMGQHDEVVLQLVIAPARTEPKPVHRHAKTHKTTAYTLFKNPEASKDEVNDRRDKLDEPNFYVALRIGAMASTDKQAEHLVRNVKKALAQTHTSNTKFAKRIVTMDQLRKRITNASTPINWPMKLSVTELATLLAWPLGRATDPGLPPSVARYFAPTSLTPSTGLLLGRSNVPGRERPVAVSWADACTHMQITGSTGSGKTVFMTNLFRQIVGAGHGAIVMETKGDLYEAALEAIPAHRMADVILMDLTDTTQPVGFNILQQGGAGSMMSELVELFEHITDLRSNWTSLALYHGLWTLMLDKRATLTDLTSLFMPMNAQEEAWRRSLISRVKDPSLKLYWSNYDRQNDREKSTRIRPLLDRLWMITARPALRNVLGQSTSSFNMQDVLKDNKILLINLSGTGDKAASEMMGTLLFNTVWGAAKAVRPEKPNFLMLDEFANFMKLPIETEELLAQARSMKLGMILAHQHLHQLPPSVKHGVRANAKTKVFFMADPDDANAMADQMGGAVTKEDMMSLPSRTAITRVSADGAISPPATIRMDPPNQLTGKGDLIRRVSRNAYGRKLADVEQEMAERRKVEPPTTVPSDEQVRFDTDW